VAPTLTNVLVRLSNQASQYNEPFLTHIRRMAAAEARGKDIPVPLPGMTIVGMRDWNSVSDVMKGVRNCSVVGPAQPRQIRIG
jgi:hypothetical protein